jgi:hypothetical protein
MRVRHHFEARETERVRLQFRTGALLHLSLLTVRSQYPLLQEHKSQDSRNSFNEAFFPEVADGRETYWQSHLEVGVRVVLLLRVHGHSYWKEVNLSSKKQFRSSE